MRIESALNHFPNSTPKRLQDMIILYHPRYQTKHMVSCFHTCRFLPSYTFYVFKTKLSLSSDNVPLVLETITDLYDNLVSGKTTMQEVESYVELQALYMKFDTNPETFQLKYLTAKLWMEYMEIVTIMRAIIRSERIGEWSLQTREHRKRC